MTLPRREIESASGWGVVVLSEAVAGAIGFVVLIHMARVLGPASFSNVEYAGVFAGLMLVWVRGGVESIAHREAARRPSLIAPLSEALALVKIGLAAAGFGVIAIFATISDRSRLPIVLASGLILVPSALSLDVGPRALGRFRLLAMIQVVRTLALAGLVWLLVAGPTDGAIAAGCVVAAETASMLVFGFIHVARNGWPRVRPRWRAARAIASRGAVASLGRFGRVFLYAADLVILGTFWSEADLGPYAASRRVVFALVAVALAVPAAVAPPLASLWAKGRDEFRDRLSRITTSLMGPALAASFGLVLTARGWMAFLFGSEYERGWPSLALIAARLPVLLLAAMSGAALVAIRRERESARIVATACALAIVAVPLSAWQFGPMGAAWAMIAIEGVGAGLGWSSLRRFGAGPSRPIVEPTDLVAVAAMSGVVVACASLPVWVTSTLGASTFGIVRAITSGWFASRGLAPSEAAR